MKQRLKQIDARIRVGIEGLNKKGSGGAAARPLVLVDPTSPLLVLRDISKYDLLSYYTKSSPRPGLVYRIASGGYNFVFKTAFRTVRLVRTGWSLNRNKT